jgi:hypothetical protein
MGINLVVIVENSKKISLKEFREGLLKDRWGRYGWRDEDIEDVWEEFKWKRKRYFTWILSPRAPHIDLYADEPPEDNPRRVLLFKVLRVVESLAGGPVYVDSDFFYHKAPDDDIPGEEFTLPPELDLFWPNWREVADRAELREVFDFVY